MKLRNIWKKVSGFTLIELLIVVAIISILAAIAIPNYLEARVRAKVAASVSNQRNIALALETYRMDNPDYPPWYMYWGDPVEVAKMPYDLLTSPIAYLSSFEGMTDPFERDVNVGYHWYRTAGRGGFCWGPRNCAEDVDYDFRGEELRAAGIPVPQNCPYALFGAGPDGVVLRESPERMLVYDSSNGTISLGTIWRFGP